MPNINQDTQLPPGWHWPPTYEAQEAQPLTPASYTATAERYFNTPARPLGWTISSTPLTFLRSQYGHPTQQAAKDSYLKHLQAQTKNNLQCINNYLEAISSDRKLAAQISAIVVSEVPD